MKRIIGFFTLAYFIVQFTGCSTVHVATPQYDHEVDFSTYQTFMFVRPKSDLKKGSANRHFITQEVLLEMRPVMEEKGFQEVRDAKDADLLIHFYTFVQNKNHFSPPTYRVGRWGRTWVASPGHVVNYKEGTLGIDIVDRKEKKLVWQGIGKDLLDRNNPAANFAEVATEILKNFPPPAK